MSGMSTPYAYRHGVYEGIMMMSQISILHISNMCIHILRRYTIHIPRHAMGILRTSSR